MKKTSVLAVLLSLVVFPVYASKLIVVDDKGGTSALPYYQALNPQPSVSSPTSSPIGVPDASMAQGLPVRSAHLSPGQVQGRVINAPGLQPFFLIGDDETSRLWLLQRGDILRQMQAVGLVVNVKSNERLNVIKSWISGVQIAPVPGDDLAQRLGIHHYPALITATAIEQ